MDISIIIVNYKSRVKTLKCLAALEASDFASLNCEVIIVDNASGDRFDDYQSHVFPLHIIYSSKNLGMGGGNNLGIQEARGEYILVLNPDTVPAPGAIKKLYEYLGANSKATLVGPKLLNPDGSIQWSCSRFPNFFMPFLRRTFLGDYFAEIRDSFTMSDFDHTDIREVDWLMGSCLMFRRQLALNSGNFLKLLFDDRYFMYFEDIDLCRQIWENGGKVVFLPEAEVIHDHARASAKYPWYIAPFKDRLARAHIVSWMRYFLKWGFARRPR